MELGVAGTLAVAYFGIDVENQVNEWLQKNPELEIIDIRFGSSATADDFGTDAFIIYRKEAE